jgi:hypothetical protein
MMYFSGSRAQPMPKNKKANVPPKLSEPEEDLLAHMQQGYQLVTDLLGGDPILRRQKDDVVIRPLSVNRNTIKALQEQGFIIPAKGKDPLTISWRVNRKKS